MVDYEGARFWLDVMQFILWAGLGVYVWVSNRHRATREQIEKLRDHHDDRLDNHADRLTRAEETLRHLPDGKAINVLTQRISELHSDLTGMKAEVTGLKDVAQLMRDHMAAMDTFLRSQK